MKETRKEKEKCDQIELMRLRKINICYGMCEEEISGLKQTVRRQQKLLHELYVELEAEREASATAATEALSMILRLQREKAADNLEAIQFKRMAQEDLNHAHQSIMLFEDTLRHKDMFIASLHFQLQAYRHQMLAMGLTHSQIQDLDHSNPDLNTLFEESAPAHLGPYWEQIKHLDTRVSGLSPGEDEDEPIPSQRGLNPLDLYLPCSSYEANDSETHNTTTATTIHDVFEVPQAQNNDNAPPLREDTNNRLRNPDCCPDEIKPGERVSVDCHLALLDLADGIFPFQTDLQRLKTRLEIGKQEVSDNEEEELRLLREIHQKLSTIQSQVTSGRARHPVVDEPSLISLMENLFFYSL